MVIEILVGAGLVLAGATAARALLRRKGDEPPQPVDAPPAKKPKQPEAKVKKPKKRDTPPPDEGPRGLRVGDVLLHAETELWLAGMLELDEEGFVARLFVAPGALRAEWVAQLDDEARDIATLSATDEVPAGPVPESLPIAGRRLTLERRGQAMVRIDGEHLPRTSPQARYVILSDAGGRVLVVVDFEKAARLALTGDRIDRHMVDLLPGGDLEKDV